jgi:hypothetical protein
MNGWGHPGVLPVSMMVFMGPPHRGLEVGALEWLVKSQPTQNLIRELKFGSPTTRALNDEFGKVAHRIPIVTCYETRQTKTAREV